MVITAAVKGILIAAIALAAVGLGIAATIVLSLITLYVPNQSKSAVCQISFRSMTTLETDAGPVAIKTADLNKDGYADLVVATYDGNNTNVYLGNGDGTFKAHTDLSNGGGAYTLMLALSDVNGDSNIDIVAANTGTNSMGVFLGKGNGAFGDQISSSTGTGSGPLGVDVADFNNDGKADLAVADNENSLLLIMNGYGNGSFAISRTYSTGNRTRPYLVVVKDFNKDNNWDVAVGNGRGNFIGIFLGDGKGNFTQQTNYTVTGGPSSIASVDMNRDGNLDIVSANYFSNTTTVLLGKGDGTFGQQSSFSTGGGSLPYAIAVGDFNRDKYQDVAIVNYAIDNFVILLGNGDGTLQTAQNFSTGTASQPLELAVADFNRDNRLDVAVVNYNNNTVGLFLSTCS